MEGERLFCMGSTVKAQIFPEGCPYCLGQFLTAQRAGTGKRRRQTFFPRRQHRRLLSEHSFPAGGLKRVYQLVFRHPFLSGKLVFRGKKGSRMHLPQSRQRGALRQLFFVDGIFQCQPCQIVIHSLMSVTRPRGKQLFWQIFSEPFVHQTDHAVHVKIGLTVRTHRQKLRFKPIISAGGPDLIDSPPLTSTVSRSFHISR